MDRRAACLPVSLAIGAIALVGCGSTTNSNGLAALDGKSLAGTSGWIPIASPLSHPVNVSGTVIPPVQTNDTTGNTVSFFDFGSSADATAFYDDPPLEARLIASGIQQYRPLAGATGVPAPSRGLDLRECIWSGGPGQGGAAGAGSPSGGTMNAAGACSSGTPSSIGVATIVLRGGVVVISQSIGKTIIGRSAGHAELTDGSLGVARYAISALALMQQVRVK
jgi:hypothetical protein